MYTQYQLHYLTETRNLIELFICQTCIRKHLTASNRFLPMADVWQCVFFKVFIILRLSGVGLLKTASVWRHSEIGFIHTVGRCKGLSRSIDVFLALRVGCTTSPLLYSITLKAMFFLKLSDVLGSLVLQCMKTVIWHLTGTYLTLHLIIVLLESWDDEV